MASVEMGLDLSILTNALASGDRESITAIANEYVLHGDALDVILGRVGMIAARGDSDGHPTITLAAAAMLCRLIQTIPQGVGESSTLDMQKRALPLFVQALLLAAPAVRAGQNATHQLPTPYFPSDLPEGKTVNDEMQTAVFNNDATLVERLLLGLYGTGADYRALQARIYEGTATTFQDAGHPLMFATRGFQLLDTVEWGDRVPNIISWLAPHMPLREASDEPAWIADVRNFASAPEHSLTSIRTRLAAPKDEQALPLRQLILSEADTTQVCQGVYDALISNGASPSAVGSVIALASADLLQALPDGDRELFVRAAHGLLYAAAVHQAFKKVQDVEILPLLFTSAAYVNSLQKEVLSREQSRESTTADEAVHTHLGGGLIASAQLETLREQMQAQDYEGALTTAQRYIKVNYDIRALFGVIGHLAGTIGALDEQGHTLQIVQAASEEYMSWPRTLESVGREKFLQIALRSVLTGKRDELIAGL